MATHDDGKTNVVASEIKAKTACITTKLAMKMPMEGKIIRVTPRLMIVCSTFVLVLSGAAGRSLDLNILVKHWRNSESIFVAENNRIIPPMI